MGIKSTSVVNPESQKFKTVETIYIAVLAVMSFVGGCASFFFNMPNVIIAICFALVPTSLIYRFLGGLGGSSLKIKGLIRLVGSAAFFFATMEYIDHSLKYQRPVITPNPNTWAALDKLGRIISVTIGGKTYAPDSTIFLAQAEWHVTDNEDGLMWVSNSVDRLAQLDPASLSEIGYFNWIEMGQGIQYVDRLTVGTVGNLSPIYPLKIKATAFRDEYNGFDVLDLNDAVIDRGTLRTRNFRMIEYRGDYYIILVRSAVHNDPNDEPWASFGVMQITPTTR